MTVLPSLLNGLEGHDRVLCISAWSRPSIAGQAIDSLALVSHDGMIGKGTESRLPYHVRSRRSAQGKPRGQRGEFFVLRPRSAKGAAKLGNSTHQIIALETESLSRAVQEFPLSDSEIAEATANAGMEKSFAKEFTVGSVYQRMGS